MKKLLVLVPDKILDLETKGEIIDRYYNPGNLFDEVHIISTTTSRPRKKTLQRLVGHAKPFLYHVPVNKALFLKTLGFNKYLLNSWLEEFLKIAKKINPNLIRCYGAHLNAYAGAFIKKNLNVPMLTSLHINPDEDIRKRDKSIVKKIVNSIIKKYELISLKNSNLVLPVYKSIIPYLKKHKIKKYRVCYNIINKNIKLKKNYKITKNVSLVCTGRLIKEKNPLNIINAVADIPGAYLTIIGDGPIKQDLERKVNREALNTKIKFISSISNDSLCKMLQKFDIFVCHSEYWELSKCVLEAFCAGLPVIINKRIGEKVPELNNKICYMVKNSKNDYLQAIKKLSSDRSLRINLARSATQALKNSFNCKNSEKIYATVYKKYLYS